ncbi:unnamed protein product [Cunninghamella blakesleeana]
MTSLTSETTRNPLYPTNSYKSSTMIYPKNYGSTLNDTKVTNSNISPNDDDESLYLLWTHQLLVEKGYKPSIISSHNDDNDDDDDDSSIDDNNINDKEELTLLFSTPPSISSPSLHTSTSSNHYQPIISSPSPTRMMTSSTSSSTTSGLSNLSQSFFSCFTSCF